MNAKLVFGLGLLALVIAVPTALAQEAGAGETSPSALAGNGGLAIGAGLAIGLAAEAVVDIGLRLVEGADSPD